MLGRSGEPGASKASDSSKLHAKPSDATPERRADDFDADLGQTIDRIDGASPGRVLPMAPGEQVLFCKLLRDGILKHFNPWRLRDVQCVLEFRCIKGLLSDDDLKHFFESSVLGKCDVALGDLRGSESLWWLKERVKEAHQGVENREYDAYPPHLTKVGSFTTKEEILREYKMLTYVPTEVYKVAVGGAHVLREVGRLGLVDGSGTIDTTTIDEKVPATYLSLACRAGLPGSVVSRLVTACPSAYVGDALQQAAQGNHLDLIDLLVEQRGVRVPRDCPECLVRLMMYGCKAHVRTVRYLVERGADIHQDGGYGTTVLHWAAESGRLDLVRFLVDEHGADVHARNDDGWTVLHNAAASGNLDLVRFLVDEHGADVHAKDNGGGTVLHWAAGSGNLDLVRFLVDEHGADVHARKDDGYTVLHSAARRCKPDLVRFLVDEHGADVREMNDYGTTALHGAAGYGNLDVVRFLVDEGGEDVHVKSRDGGTVLHHAAGTGDLDLVQFLVDERGADVHERSYDGRTALHRAAFMGKLEMVRFLVDEHGADVHAKNVAGETALHHSRDPSCKAFLRDRMERNAPRKRTTRGEAC